MTYEEYEKKYNIKSTDIDTAKIEKKKEIDLSEFEKEGC